MTDYPVVGSISDSGAIRLLEAYFLALFDRTYPVTYLFPIKTTPNGGYELFQATGALGERVSLALQRLESGLLTMTAPVGEYATGVVQFRRPTAVAGAVTINQGTVVSTSANGRQFVLLHDVVFGAGAVGPINGSVQAQAVGYEFNVRGERTTASGAVLPGDIDTIYTLLTTPVFSDRSFVVSQTADMLGGTASMLELLGVNRGVTRYANEPVENYRFRVRSLPDTVSPGAIKRTVQTIMAPSLSCFREVGNMAYFRGFFFDGDDTTGNVDKYDFYDVDSRKFSGAMVSGSFVVDEPIQLRNGLNIVMTGWLGSLTLLSVLWMIRDQGQVPASLAGLTIVGVRSGAVFNPASATSVQPAVNNRRWRLVLDEVEFRGFFVVGLPRLNSGEFGLHFDAGPRNAWDYNATVSPTGTQNGYDGYPVQAFRQYATVYKAIQPIKAGGVGFDLYIEDISCP